METTSAHALAPSVESRIIRVEHNDTPIASTRGPITEHTATVVASDTLYRLEITERASWGDAVADAVLTVPGFASLTAGSGIEGSVNDHAHLRWQHNPRGGWRWTFDSHIPTPLSVVMVLWHWMLDDTGPATETPPKMFTDAGYGTP